MPSHHAHTHAHHPGPANATTLNRAFAFGVALNAAFVVVEAVAGVLAGSLALLADAGHNLSDVLALVLAWLAHWVGGKPPRRGWTYGFGRASILASVINATVLLIGVGAIGLTAVRRWAEPSPIAEDIVIAVAGAGVVINGATAALFLADRKADLNVRSAFLHMVADAGLSLAVVVAAALIAFTGWLWLDPALSLVIAAAIAVSAWALMIESWRLALDAVPERVDRDAVEVYLATLPGVTDVHDLHIWPLSTRQTALTAHLVRPDSPADDAFLDAVAAELDHRFGIAHATLQVEQGHGPCRLAPTHVV
jgi:cobalt-zinc-cadmium efflux system protein